MRGYKNNGAVFMKLFLVPALFLAGLLISINPVHAEATWQNTFEYFNLDEPASGQTSSCGQLKSMPVIDSGPNALSINSPGASLCTTEGKFGQALYPQNGNSINSGPNNKHAAKIGKMSFSFWIKIVSPLDGNDQVWSQDWCTNNGDFFQITYRYWDNKIHLHWNNAAGRGVDYTTLNWNMNDINDGQWHNIIIEYDIGVGPLGWYVDGVEQDAGMYTGWPYTEQYSWQVIFPDAIPGNLDSFANGCYSYLSSTDYGLAIDDVAIVQDEITPEQIALLQTESYGDMLGAKPAQIPTLSGLGQFKSDGTTAIAEGGGTAGKVILQGTPISPSGNQVQLQVEVRPSATAFNGTPTASSTFAASGQLASITIANLSNGQYHWQARAVDSQGNASPWQTMSNPVVATDFTINNLEPVVIVPGILGSVLNQGNNQLWPNVGNMLLGYLNGDSYLDQLILNSDGSQKAGNLVALSDIVRDVITIWPASSIWPGYLNLINGLKNMGYTENAKYNGGNLLEQKNLFVAPYDWRLDINSQLNVLNNDIQQAINNSPDGKINIIAHSMGGLLVKKYLAGIGSKYSQNIDKLIFAGVPNLGAPLAFKALTYGDSFGIPPLSPVEMKKISQNMPSVYELLPSQGYFSNNKDTSNGGYIYDFSGLATTNQPDDYYGTVAFMTSGKTTGRRNSTLINNATNFHQDDNAPVNISPTTKFYNIVGCDGDKKNNYTPGIFYVYGGYLNESPNSTESVDNQDEYLTTKGDDTVPVVSADSFTNTTQTYFIKGATHLGLISDSIPLALIDNLVSGNSNPAADSSVSENLSDCPMPPPTYRFSTHSPVQLNVYDASGNHVGLNSNGNRVDLQIPDSDYQTLGYNSFIDVPATTSVYRIVANATSSGSFTLDVDSINGTIITNRINYVNIPLATSHAKAELDFSGSQQNNLTLKVDGTGSGTFNQFFQPTSILSGSAATDIMPPTSTATLSGTKGNDNWYTSNVKVTLSAQDNAGGSGVLNTIYSLDNGNTWLTYSAPITLSTEGSNTVLYHSEDKAGNPEAINAVVIKIDKTAPEASVSVSTTTRNILVQGIDHIASTTVTKDSSGNFIITNDAGHTTKLVFDNSFGLVNKLLFLTGIFQFAAPTATIDLSGNYLINNNASLPIFTNFFAPSIINYAQLFSIQYDSATAIKLPLTHFFYAWNGANKTLSNQTIFSVNNFFLQAFYNSKTNQTTLYFKQKGQSFSTKTFTGLEIPRLTTSKGTVGYGL